MKQKLRVCAVMLAVGAIGTMCAGDLIDFEDTHYTTPTGEAIWDDEYVTRGVTNLNPVGAAGYILPYPGSESFRFIAPHSGTRAVYVNTGVFPQPSFQRLIFSQPVQSVSFWVAVSGGDGVGVGVADLFGQDIGLSRAVSMQVGQWTFVSIEATSAVISVIQVQAQSQDTISYSPWAIDDLTFVVPSPGSAAVLGLFALVGRRRR